MPELDNPYWDLVKPYVTPAQHSWDGPQAFDIFTDIRTIGKTGKFPPNWAANFERGWEFRRQWTMQFAWSITDPDSVQFVAEQCRGQLIDPIAGTGYWTYLLGQLGIDCFAYDLNPPDPASNVNHWHQAARMHMSVMQGEAVDAVTVCHPARTLFLSWPPYDTVLAHDVLESYSGDRLIYIGEGEGGCTADDAFFERLSKDWSEDAVHRIVQWGGIRDLITVYDRIDASSKP